MHIIPSTNFLIHLVESLPTLPSIHIGNWKFQKPVLDSELDRTLTAAAWLRDAHVFGDMDHQQYTQLRNTLRDYRENLRWLTSPIQRCPTELILRIFKYATPEVHIEASFASTNAPQPYIYCPQIVVLSMLSRQFHALVHSHPELFTSIQLRRRINCPNHPRTLLKSVSKLLAMTGSWSLQILVEVPNPGDYGIDVADTVPLSPCPLMQLLQSRPWRRFLFLGPSYLATTVLRTHDQLSLVNTPAFTAIHLTRVSSLATFLKILASSNIPLETFSLSAVDSWRLPHFNNDLHDLPGTVRHLRIRGSSRTVLYVLQAARHVPSIQVILVTGVDSHTGNWQMAGNAPQTHVLQHRIPLPNLATFHYADEDYWGHVGPNLFRWFDAPNLTAFSFEWRKSTTYFNIDYHNSLVQFLTRNPTISVVYFFNTPAETAALIPAVPQCTFQRFTDRLPPLERVDWRHRCYEDSDSDSDSDTLSVASNGIVNECQCPVGYYPCDCFDPPYVQYVCFGF
ncbi:hypothetical protein VNI00_017586 [Paramarasmius palmivorus]|uniref:F-box domain-containing protein n=1 Tax=Paramarasmius palmivorus TaxID=297713 RepID=A0AAW0B4M1_9AGAR